MRWSRRTDSWRLRGPGGRRPRRRRRSRAARARTSASWSGRACPCRRASWSRPRPTTPGSRGRARRTGCARRSSTAYAALGRPPVAVRSSATAEDLADASFAGQQDTYLNVRGDDALLDAVRRCWASLWTERAVAYRAEQGIDARTVAMAVVVQKMVEADAAGVLFTANPANGRRQETVVAAAWGLGEAVVGGLVDTDELVVRAPDGPVLSRAHRRQDDHDRLRRPAARPSARCRPGRRGEPVLDDAAAVALTALGAARRGALRCTAGHRVGAPRRRVLPAAGPADHRAAAAGGGPAHRLVGARPVRPVRPREHRRAAARPADAAVRRPGRTVGHAVAAGVVPRARGRRTSSATATSTCRRSTATPTTATAWPGWAG